MAFTADRLLDESGDVLVQEGDSGAFTIEVAPVSIAVAPAASTISGSATVLFTATATLPDGSTQDVTNSVAWSVSAPANGTVSSAGVYVSTDLIGDNTVSATQSSIVGSATVTNTGRGAILSQYVAEALVGQRGQRARTSQVVAEVLVGLLGAKVRETQYVAEILTLSSYVLDVTPQNEETLIGVPVQYLAIKRNQLGVGRQVSVAWSVDPAAGTITANGLFTPSSDGQHVITATEIGNA